MAFQIISIEDSVYPDSLRSIDDPPKRLYCEGDVSLLSMKKVAVVGSRKFSQYGRWVSDSVSKLLGKSGVCVVSGMAQGIDTCAHQGALSAGGKTIAVLGTGLDLCYPASNRSLMQRISENGLVITEYPNGYPVRRYNFPRRNRIISGLSECVVLAEAGLNSGALITAEMAANQGKDVYVVPGNINNRYGLGGNLLIRDGAIPLVILNDILNYIGVETKDGCRECKNLSDKEKIIYKYLEKHGEVSVDEVAQKLKIKPSKLNGIITVMEIKGAINTSTGKIFIADKLFK